MILAVTHVALTALGQSKVRRAAHSAGEQHALRAEWRFCRFDASSWRSIRASVHHIDVPAGPPLSAVALPDWRFRLAPPASAANFRMRRDAGGIALPCATRQELSDLERVGDDEVFQFGRLAGPNFSTDSRT